MTVILFNWKTSNECLAPKITQFILGPVSCQKHLQPNAKGNQSQIELFQLKIFFRRSVENRALFYNQIEKYRSLLNESLFTLNFINFFCLVRRAEEIKEGRIRIYKNSRMMLANNELIVEEFFDSAYLQGKEISMPGVICEKFGMSISSILIH